MMRASALLVITASLSTRKRSVPLPFLCNSTSKSERSSILKRPASTCTSAG